MNISLSEEQAMLLERILTTYLADLRMEIAGTDDVRFRSALKDEKLSIEPLLDSLRQSHSEPIALEA
ncbi:MAG: hypothetical protein ACYDCC_09125 [Actinomycetota bacterium]